jgi:hypothetical protein
MSFWSTLGKIGSGVSNALQTGQRIADGVNQARDLYGQGRDLYHNFVPKPARRFIRGRVGGIADAFRNKMGRRNDGY